jgi:membrane protein required for colicin V production
MAQTEPPVGGGEKMEQFGFTWFDLAALAVLALSGIMAFARGLIREVFSIIAFIGAAIAAVFFADMARPLIEGVTSLSGSLASVAAGLVVFLIVFIVITVVTSMLAKTAHQSTEIGSFDRAAGLAFGILRGVLVVALFVLLMRQTTDDPTLTPQASMPEAIVSARTYPIYEGVAKALERILPQARQRASDIIDREKRGESPVAVPQAVPAGDSQP